jgi:surface protein
MFSNTTALTSLYLIDFNTAKVTNMSYMFYGCSNMTAIYVDGTWNTAAVTSSGNMFYNCTNLSYIKAMFLTSGFTSVSRKWVYGVAQNGTFVMNADAKWKPDDFRGADGVPVGWTVEYSVN